MQDEKNARKCRRRLYGFVNERSRAILSNQRILVESSFRSGLRLDDSFIKSHTPEVRWVVANNVAEPYILLTFPSAGKCKAVKKTREKADISYRPHGRPITICMDLPPEEDICVDGAGRTLERLCSKNAAVLRRGIEIRIRNPPKVNVVEIQPPETAVFSEKSASSSARMPK